MSDKTVLESLIEFEQKIEEHNPSSLSIKETIALRKKLITEEYLETIEALELLDKQLDETFDKDKLETLVEDTAKELADLVYVTYGTAERLGIDLDEGFDIVHRSNMSKIGGNVSGGEKRADGKILKPKTYVSPDMGPVVQGSPILKTNN